MSYPAVVLLHTNDPCYRPQEAEAGPINAVLASLGGERMPFDEGCGRRVAPAVAIIHAVTWPRWPEALQAIKTMWRGTSLVGIFEEETINSQALRSVVSDNLNDFLCAPVREAEL